MKKSLLLLTSLLMLFVCSGVSNAWEINFNFNLDDIKKRNIGKVLIGGVVSVAVHETGHFVAGRSMGMPTRYGFDGGPVVYAPGLNDKSETDQAIFAVAGMLSQVVVGTALTVWANDSDYTLGFNGMAAGCNLSYPLRDNPNSDWHRIPNGKLVTFGHGLYSTGLTLINLKIISATP
jgi:hypothetical protein